MSDLDRMVTDIVEAVASLERHPYDLACPFGCNAPAATSNDPHADDCPIALARLVTSDRVVERRSSPAPRPNIGPLRS